jgi:tRNA(Ile2)-agmatinylcytidine synthase
VRLNPNLPWKTRGNASVSLCVDVEGDHDIDKVTEIVEQSSMNYVTHVSKGLETNRKPGYAIGKVEELNRFREDLKKFYEIAVSDVITVETARRFAKNRGIIIGGDRGIIGSLASMGFTGSYTFELLTYRKPESWDKRREVDSNSVVSADSLFFPKVFANYDYNKKITMILSHGTDPVLYGLRGLSPEILLKEMEMIKVNEEIDFFMLFKTNQMTDAHIKRTGTKFYQTADIELSVRSVETTEGGHVIINSVNYPVIVYKETRELNSMAKALVEGDRIRVIGSIKPSRGNSKIIEAERIEVIALKDTILDVPLCPTCGRKMESVGKNKGYRCRRCKTFKPYKEIIKVNREISLGIYQSPLYRHLSRPVFLDPIDKELREEEEKNILEMIISKLKMSNTSIKMCN